MKIQLTNQSWGHRSASKLVLTLSLFWTLTIPAGLAMAAKGIEKSDSFIAAKLNAHSTLGRTRVIVRLACELTPDREFRLKQLGARIYKRLPIVKSVALSVPNRNLDNLAILAFVKRLSADSMVNKCDEFSVGSSGADVAFSQYNLTGLGVTVAVVDSGINNQQDLTDYPYSNKTRVIGTANYVPGGTKSNDACGHGTHVAGIIAGDGCDSVQKGCYRSFFGIARRVNLVDVRVLDQYGKSSVSTVIAGLQWAVANKAQYNIRVINLSLGHPVGESYMTDPLCQAVEAAWKAGIVVVCAAGNSGRLNASPIDGQSNEGYGTAYGSIQSPANDPYVITVGATKSVDGLREHDPIATYSARGPSRLDMVLKPDIVAPGNRIISLCAANSFLDTTYGDTNYILLKDFWNTNSKKASGVYYKLSGTSMAAPVIAGAAALMLEKDPTLSPDTIKARLMISADKWTDKAGNYDPCTYGAGYVNIPAALNCDTVAAKSAISPSLFRDDDGNVLVEMGKILWGTNVIWGASGVSKLNVIWGSNIIWGSNVIWGSKVLWGSSVWADNIIWGAGTGCADLSSTAINGEN